MVTVTFVRHGESEDNTKSVWAGWKDTPLSPLGRMQANAVAQFFTNTKFTHIYASPLLRALATGEAIQQAQPHRPPLTPNPKLREQHFGVAEGQPWVYDIPEGKTAKELMENNIYPVLPNRVDKFPQGESLEDLARRAEEAVEECILPHLGEKDGEEGVQIAIASHGLCISELIAALLRLDPDSRRDVSYTGLLNTAWTRVIVSRKEDGSSALTIHVTDVNMSKHLSLVVNPNDSIVNDGNAAARSFFGGNAQPGGDVLVDMVSA